MCREKCRRQECLPEEKVHCQLHSDKALPISREVKPNDYLPINVFSDLNFHVRHFQLTSNTPLSTKIRLAHSIHCLSEKQHCLEEAPRVDKAHYIDRNVRELSPKWPQQDHLQFIPTKNRRKKEISWMVVAQSEPIGMMHSSQKHKEPIKSTYHEQEQFRTNLRQMKGGTRHEQQRIDVSENSCTLGDQAWYIRCDKLKSAGDRRASSESERFPKTDRDRNDESKCNDNKTLPPPPKKQQQQPNVSKSLKNNHTLLVIDSIADK